MSKHLDHLFKVIVVGDSGVPKTKLVHLADSTTTETTKVGCDFTIRNLVIDGEKIKLQIWDTAEMHPFKIVSTYYRGTSGIIIMYEVCDKTTFTNIPNWLYEINQNCDSSVIKILVGAEGPSEEQRLVRTEEAESFAEEMNLKFYETSLQEKTDVEDLFMTLAKDMVRKRKIQIEEAELQLQVEFDTVQLGATEKRKKKCI
ncbi:ras-related protein Rab-35-like [Gigantopelta aegis]|uniref:ras-related protein Rab-35-like n=1 Tax=Gigantopelta aegis TaxID=1735272 RepID=UPI001B88B447|nr:ras-related protein Rab-35-like [Gigantopelta aegis]